MKLLFFISSMESGGAERVMAVLTNELASRGHDITLGIATERKSFYELHPKIKVKQFPFQKNKNIFGKIKNRIKLFKFIRKLSKSENPDVIISFIYQMNTNVLLSTRFLGIPVVASEHNTLNQKKSFFHKIQRFQISKLADRLTILTQYDYEFLGKRLKHKLVMPNPLPFTPIVQYNNDREKTILAVGNVNRYEHKGFDNLIEIWSSIADTYPDWKLKIAGSYTKDSLEYLQSIEKKHQIKNRIQFLGQIENVLDLYRESSIFILSSRWEGFGMVLVEAMSQGCACISYDLIAGPNEIITDGVDGILVENQNKEEMTNKLIMLVEKSDIRERLAKEAIKSINQFSVERIIDRWEILLSEVIKK